jgi:DNA-binding LacI/PurR family transcriptional regulator
MSAPTILDVAARAGVSKSSVSRVLLDSPFVSDSTRTAVQRAIKDLGFRPNHAARTLVSRRSGAIGVLVTDFHNPFFQDVLDGIDAVAAPGKYTPIVVSGKRMEKAEEGALHRLLELQVDGIVCVTATPMRHVLQEAARVTPLVILTRTPELPRVDSVVNDNFHGATLVVRHLVEFGHQKIAMVADEQELAGTDRILGYREAMGQAGLSEEVRVAPGGFTEAGGYAGARALLESDPDVTAIFAANDLSALGVLNAAVELGLDVPGDLSVVGYDNIFAASLRHINLTTIDQRAKTIGEAATKALLERIEDPSRAARRIVTSPVLVPRSTSGPPRQAR